MPFLIVLTLSCSGATEATQDLGAQRRALDAPADGGASSAVRGLPIGVITRTFVDPTRPTPENGSAPAKPNRTLVTDIWYPTSESTGSREPKRNAPLAPGGPYPLVLFVHGSSSGRLFSTYITKGLARAGYVAAAADFPLTVLGTAGGASDWHVSDQVGDLAFLADQLQAISEDVNDALHGAVDGLGYAVVGHSTGGAVAVLAAFAGDDALVTHDPRVRAVVPLSGDACMFGPAFFKTRDVPVFAIGGSDDLFVRIANSGQWVFDNAGPRRLLANLVGGRHMGFTNFDIPDALLKPVPTGANSPLAQTLQLYGDASACQPIPPPGTDPKMAFATQHILTVELVASFLDAELRHDPAPLDAVKNAHDPRVIIRE